MKTKYPDECPVFSLRYEWNQWWPKGTICQISDSDPSSQLFGVGVRNVTYSITGRIGYSSLIALRPLTDAAQDLLNAITAEWRHR